MFIGMTVLNPNNTTHTLKIIPRFYPSGNVTLDITREDYSPGFSLLLLPIIQDGYMYLPFDHEFENASSWSVKVSESDEVVYRGKIYVTDQSDDTQGFKLSKDIFVL